MITPIVLDRPALFDSSVWTWSRDKRFPELSDWFNDATQRGLVLSCDLVVMELARLGPNERLTRKLLERLSGFNAVRMPPTVWTQARAIQLALTPTGDHRRVPPTDLLIAAAALAAGVPVVHYDRDYERIAAVTNLEQYWFVPDGSLV